MKPITNILLVIALVCYVFLPFYNIQLQGGISGLEFTAGLITRTGTFKGIGFALMPFICCFLAIMFNSLKNKYWSLASLLLLCCSLYFYHTAGHFTAFSLAHSPEVTPMDDLGEGLPIESLGYGFLSSCVLVGLSIISAIVSLLPFKFNEAIERVVDDALDKSVEEGRKHIKSLGHEVRGEWNKIESKTVGRVKKKNSHAKTTQPEAPKQPEADIPPIPEVDIPPIPEDKEDDSRFMPH